MDIERRCRQKSSQSGWGENAVVNVVPRRVERCALHGSSLSPRLLHQGLRRGSDWMGR